MDVKSSAIKQCGEKDRKKNSKRIMIITKQRVALDKVSEQEVSMS